MEISPQLKNTLAFQQVEKVLEQGNVSHAYFFIGEASKDIQDTALFMAQSLLCYEKLACGVCGSCLRVQQHDHPDFWHFNGNEKSITKKDLDELQQYFSKTAVENKFGRRVCFLEHMENASLSAQNSLLKFLEEPADGVVIILSAPSESSILATLLSRCIPIRFQSKLSSQIEEKVLKLGYSQEDAYFLSLLCQSEEEIQWIYEQPEFSKAIFMLQESLEQFDELLVDYHVRFKPKEKEAHLFLLNAFFRFVASAMRESLKQNPVGPEWLKKYIQTKKEETTQASLYALMVEALDKLNKYNDPTLLFEQTIYEWRKLRNDNKRRK